MSRASREIFTATAIALVASLICVLLLPPGGDYPAAEFRVWLFQQDGFSNWNPQWYGGHETLGYSVLLPPLGALIGVAATLVVTTTVSAGLFAALTVREFGAKARYGAYWLALALPTNVLIGRAAFALGTAIGLAALLAWQRKHLRSAVVLAFLTPLGSPVAGAFLALCTAARWGAQPTPRASRFGLVLTVVALATTAVVGLVFSDGGSQPFSFDYLIVILAISAVALITLQPERRALRLGAALYMLASVLLFLVPTGMGNNIVRLAVLFGGPLLLGLWLTDGIENTPLNRWIKLKQWLRRLLAAIFLAACVFSQVDPADDVLVNAANDRSLERSYYKQLFNHLEPLGSGERVEIVPTLNHWESFYVAKRLPLARGWERQLDTKRNGIFYEEKLTPATYCKWLRENRVNEVALATVSVDFAAVREREVIVNGAPCLRLRWRDFDWSIYRVAH